jgi:hypothetical protein
MTPEEYQKEREYKRLYYRERYGKKHKYLSGREGMTLRGIVEMTGKDDKTVWAWIQKIPDLSERLKKYKHIGGAAFNDEEVKAILKIAGDISERFTGESSSHLYSIWKSMRQRCENPKHKGYKYYGGKGIAVCEQWAKFINFREWATDNGYKDGLSIDRIDSDKGYFPENCQWITLAENTKRARDKRYGRTA